MKHNVKRAFNSNAVDSVVHEFDDRKDAWDFVVADIRVLLRQVPPEKRNKVDFSEVAKHLFLYGHAVVDFNGSEYGDWADYFYTVLSEPVYPKCALCEKYMATCSAASHSFYDIGCKRYARCPESDIDLEMLSLN